MNGLVGNYFCFYVFRKPTIEISLREQLAMSDDEDDEHDDAQKVVDGLIDGVNKSSVLDEDLDISSSSDDESDDGKYYNSMN